MPGFQIHMSKDEKFIPSSKGAGDSRVKAKPSRPIYVYTWDIIDFLGEQFYRSKRFKSEVYLKDVTLPDITFDVDEVKGSSLKYKYAKEPNFSDVKISFYDTDGLYDALNQMRKLIWNQQEGMRPANEYKKETRIMACFADDITAAYEWILYGCWMKGLSSSPLTYTSSDMHNVNVVLTYDWADLKTLY